MFNSESQRYYHGQLAASFMWGVYGWMSCALAITAYVSYALSLIPSFFYAIHTNPILLMTIFIVQLGLVIGLSGLGHRISFATAATLFLVYAASVGVTLSSIFYVYTLASIGATFVTCAGMFGAMALYGYFTRSDLTNFGSFGIMILFGLIIGMFVNLFLQNQAFDMLLSGVGVILFTLLTAYDTQKIKMIGSQLIAEREVVAKVTVFCALTLYLDFINLFLFLLRFMGKRRED